MEAGEMDTPTELRETAPSGKRRIASRILLVVFCITTVLALVAGWARLQIEDTDRYVETVAPLASDPSIQQALIDRVTTQLSAQLDERVTIDLIEDSALAAPVAMLVEEYIRDTVSTFVMSDDFPVLWEQINRASHPLVTAVLTGSGSESIATDQGQITLDLAPLMTEVINRLDDRGVDIVDRIQVDQLDTTFVVYESEDLASTQDAVALLEQLAVALPVVALVSLVAALAVSTGRRATVIWAGLGLAATMALFLVLLAILRWWVVDHLPPESNPQAATVFFETLGRSMRDAASALTVVGLLAAGVVFVTRPSAWVRREGRAAGGTAKAAWKSYTPRWPGLTQAGSWIDSHRMAIGIALGVAASLLVVLWDPLDADRALWIVVVTALGCGGLALIHWWSPATALAPVPATAIPVATSPAPDSVATKINPVERTTTDRLAGGEGGQDALSQLASEISIDDLRLLSRIAAALRDTSRVDPGNERTADQG
jgi:hypothetical protein